MKTVLTILLVVYFSNINTAQDIQQKWIAPDSANYLLNPYKEDPSLVGTSVALFVEHCVLCHGEKGDGEGIAASTDIMPADLVSEDVQKQTDGVLFWKLSHGHNRMIGYKAVLTERERWGLVNYIRTLGGR